MLSLEFELKTLLNLVDTGITHFMDKRTKNCLVRTEKIFF